MKQRLESILAHLLAWGFYAIIVSLLSLLFLVEASAQTAPPLPPMTIIVQPGQTQPLNVVAATPVPTPTPVPSSCISITSPAPNVSVSSSVPIQTVDNCSGAWFERLYVDGATAGDFDKGKVVWNTIGASPGAHPIAVVAQSRNPSSTPVGVAAQMLQVAAPPPTPTPTVSPTPAGWVSDPQFPDNTVANNNVPSAAWWTAYMSNVASLNGQPCSTSSAPCELPAAVLQHIDQTPFIGTTDQILSHVATEYQIPADYARGAAWQETQWTESGVGDCSGISGCTSDGGSGISTGILQDKIGPYPSNYWFLCPAASQSQQLADLGSRDCMSHLSTWLTANFWAFKVHQCAIGAMQTYMAANGRDHGTPGVSDYMTEVRGGTAIPDCIGQHFGGDWRSAGNLAYTKFVLGYASSKPWLQGIKARRKGMLHARNISRGK